jgi:xanthine dehydrogenase molybdopterin-binding subunit B
MQDSGTAIRHAAAQVRTILIGLAAERIGVPAARLSVRDGVVGGEGLRGVPYGELVAGQVLHVEADPQSVLRAPAERALVGTSMQRVDLPAKVSGGPAFVQDLRLAGMVHGRVLHPPSRGARLVAVDLAAVARLPGVLKVVQDGTFLGVIAEREFQALTALRALGAAATWEERPTLPVPAELYQWLRDAGAEEQLILGRGAVPASDSGVVSATYRRPYQAHASIGPSCAVARLSSARYTVWTHSQGVFPLRRALAEMLDVPAGQVHCIHVEGAGCYGHNGADDVAAEAALLARALPGRPVRLQWMREDEHAWEPFGPPMIGRLRATLDRTGSIDTWQYEVWSNPHSSRPGPAGNLLPATQLARPFRPPRPRPLPQPEGGGDRNAIPLYVLPNARVLHRFVPAMPLRVSALRSLGAYLNVFAIESFMDELAATARADPVTFRRRHLVDERALEVVRVANDRFGWERWKRAPRRGRGFAFARYKNLAAFAAVAVEAEVLRETGAVRILRAVAAVDCGEVVNPDGVRNQIEGGIVQSASWTLAEEVAFDAVRVTSCDWGGYPILRFPQVPQAVEVHLVERPGQPFLGVGEAAQGPAAAAIANAIADATGVRLRDLPLTPARVRAAVGP